MDQYIKICNKALREGIRKTNRTGVDHIGYTGDMMQFNLQKGFPAVTTKRLSFNTVVAEMLGFLRGYSNAAEFRKLGCNVWDANANENKQWLNNEYRKEKDDLGRIYGVQARAWKRYRPTLNYMRTYDSIDQLQKVYKDLKAGIDNRREIVTHWNPGEMNQMALPPCHMFYQFGIQGDYLNLSMYQRSCDLPLGIPFNIAGYAWLLSVFAQITSLKPGTFTHFMHDIHVYENQVDLLTKQILREPFMLPEIKINPAIRTLKDLETWVMPSDFALVNYVHHAPVKYPFAV